MKGSLINNYAGIFGIMWDSPGQTRTYGQLAIAEGFGNVVLLLCKMDMMAVLSLQGSHMDSLMSR